MITAYLFTAFERRWISKSVMGKQNAMNRVLRYYLLTTILLLVFVGAGYSQIQINIITLPELNISPLLSQNTSSISTKSSIGYGVQIGINATTNKSQHINWQIGFAYRNRNLRLNIDNIIFPTAVGQESNILYEDTNIQHLVIPFNLMLRISNTGQLFIGASAEILLNESRTRTTLNEVERDFLINSESSFKNTPISINTGYALQLSNNLNLIANMNYGFSQIGLPLLQPNVNFQLATQIGLQYTM